MLRQFRGDGGCGPRSATDADGPVGLVDPLGVELAHHAKNASVE